MNLDKLVNEYNGKLQENPPLDFGVRVNKFIDELQAQKQDVSQWGEDEWREAFKKLGVPESAMVDMLENLASWGVVDNYNWE